MNIEITFGWWLVPAALTAAIWTWAFVANSDNRGSGYGADIAGMIVFGVAIIVSLFVWLVWAVLS